MSAPKQNGEKQFCDECEFNQWIRLTPEIVMQHLIGYKEDGTDVIGVYPLFPDGTCRFLVFDFDNHVKGADSTDYANDDNAWHEEVDALRLMCEMSGVTPLVERSRSGRGAHVWIFFDRPVQASLAKNFGFMLLDKGAASVNMKSFHYYDRMYPAQDKVIRSVNNSDYNRVVEMWFECQTAWCDAVAAAAEKCSKPAWAETDDFPYLKKSYGIISIFLSDYARSDNLQQYRGYITLR